jgi:hypothetical protein
MWRQQNPPQAGATSQEDHLSSKGQTHSRSPHTFGPEDSCCLRPLVAPPAYVCAVPMPPPPYDVDAERSRTTPFGRGGEGGDDLFKEGKRERGVGHLVRALDTSLERWTPR